MKISANNLIQPNTGPGTRGNVTPDQATAFADRLEKAVAASKQAGNPAASDPAKRSQDAKLKAACQEMEAVFLNMMLAKMRETVPKSKLLGDSSQEDIMTSLLDTELTKNMAKAGGIGLADMLYRQLSINEINKSRAAR
ncbi:hypothetical protein SCACP_32740 [Sporomusa carbonis]|uniref:rod-binding protein n=1 Tax=Sporomusa carbonis TaxID=3076075 RepID=UPI003A717C4D